MAGASPIYQQINDRCRELVSSCAAILERVQGGCDNKMFFGGVQSTKIELQKLAQVVQEHETTCSVEKKEVLNKTLGVKNVVIQVITELREIHKSVPPGTPAATGQQLGQFKNRLMVAIRELGKSAQKLAITESHVNKSSRAFDVRQQRISQFAQNGGVLGGGGGGMTGNRSPNSSVNERPSNYGRSISTLPPRQSANSIGIEPKHRNAGTPNRLRTRPSHLINRPASPSMPPPVEGVKSRSLGGGEYRPGNFSRNGSGDNFDRSEIDKRNDTRDSRVGSMPASPRTLSNKVPSRSLSNSSPGITASGTISKLYDTAIKCLESLEEMCSAVEEREKDRFTNATKSTINLVNHLVVQQQDISPDGGDENGRESQGMLLREYLVSLISHSKMYFVNPDDEYFRSNFFTFKTKVETSVSSYLTPSQFAIWNEQRGVPAGSRMSSSPNNLGSNSPTARFVVNVKQINRRSDELKTSPNRPSPRAGGNDGNLDALSHLTRRNFKPSDKRMSSKIDINTKIYRAGDDTEADDFEDDYLDSSSGGGGGSRDNLLNAQNSPRLVKSTSALTLPSGSRRIPLSHSATNSPTGGNSHRKRSDVSRQNRRRSLSHDQLEKLRERCTDSDELVEAETVEEIVEYVRQMCPGDYHSLNLDKKRSFQEYLHERLHALMKHAAEAAIGEADGSGEGEGLGFERSPNRGGVDEHKPLPQIPGSTLGSANRSPLLIRSQSENYIVHSSPTPEFTTHLSSSPDTPLSSTQTSTSPPSLSSSRTPSTLSASTTGSGSSYPSSNKHVTKSKSKKKLVKAIEKTDTFRSLRIKGKSKQKDSRGDGMCFRLLEVSSSTPRSSRSFQLSNSICALLKGLTDFYRHFDLKETSWKPSSVQIPQKDSSILPRCLTECRNVLEWVAGTIDNTLNSGALAGAMHEKTRNRFLQYKARDKQPEVLKTDMKLYSKGQYVSYMRMGLLTDIYNKTDILHYVGIQCVSVMRMWDQHDICSSILLLTLTDTLFNVLGEIMDDLQTFDHIYNEWEKHARNHIVPFQSTSSPANSLWNEPEEPTSLDKDDLFRAGTLNALVIRLTASTFNSDLMVAFLSGYELFSSPREVWEKLEDRYNVPETAAEKDQAQFVKMRVANVILQWIKQDITSIDSSVLAAMERFAMTNLKNDKFNELSEWVLKELSQMGRFGCRITHPRELPSHLPVFGFTGGINPYEILLTHNRTAVAEQLTLIEFEIYQRISRTELTMQKWSKDKLQILARNTIALITRVNRLSFYVALTVLLQKKLKDRIKYLVRIIGIAKALYDMNNFNSLMGVLAGLSMAPISRLKHTWAKIPAKQDEVFRNLETIQDPTKSFAILRDHVKNAGPVAMPYIGTHLSDLTFMDEGNPDFIEVENAKLINFPKHHLVQRTIKNLLQYQSCHFDIAPKEPLFTFLQEMPGLPEKELYDLSLEREPRNSLPKDLE